MNDLFQSMQINEDILLKLSQVNKKMFIECRKKYREAPMSSSTYYHPSYDYEQLKEIIYKKQIITFFLILLQKRKYYTIRRMVEFIEILQYRNTIFTSECQGQRYETEPITNDHFQSKQDLLKKAQYLGSKIKELMISRGAHWDCGLEGACIGGHLDIIILIINYLENKIDTNQWFFKPDGEPLEFVWMSDDRLDELVKQKYHIR